MERKINCKHKNQKNPQILLLGPSITADKNNRNSQITVAEEDFIVEGDYNHHNTQAIVMGEGLNHHNSKIMGVGDDLKLQALTTIQINH